MNISTLTPSYEAMPQRLAHLRVQKAIEQSHKETLMINTDLRRNVGYTWWVPYSFTCVLSKKARIASKRLRLMPCSGPVSTSK